MKTKMKKVNPGFSTLTKEQCDRAVKKSVAAARAFKEKYSELVKTAHAPVWFVSLGDNPEKRRLATNEAARLNLITSKQAEQLLLGTDKPTTTTDKLLESAAQRTSNEKAKAMLSGLRLVIDNTKPEKSKSELLREHESLLRDKFSDEKARLHELHPDEFITEQSTAEV